MDNKNYEKKFGLLDLLTNQRKFNEELRELKIACEHSKMANIELSSFLTEKREFDKRMYKLRMNLNHCMKKFELSNLIVEKREYDKRMRKIRMMGRFIIAAATLTFCILFPMKIVGIGLLGIFTYALNEASIRFYFGTVSNDMLSKIQQMEIELASLKEMADIKSNDLEMEGKKDLNNSCYQRTAISEDNVSNNMERPKIKVKHKSDQNNKRN